MTEAVVHRLEVVEVDEQDGDPIRGIASHPPQRLRHPLDEVTPVGQVRERVVQGPVHELLLGLLARRDVVGDRCGADGTTLRVQDR